MPIISREFRDSPQNKKELAMLDAIWRDVGIDIFGQQLKDRIDYLLGLDIYKPDTSKDTFINRMKCSARMSHEYTEVHQGEGIRHGHQTIYTDYECSRCSSHLRIYD